MDPGTVRVRVENPPPPVFDPRTVRPIASRYADYAIPTTSTSEKILPHFGKDTGVILQQYIGHWTDLEVSSAAI